MKRLCVLCWLCLLASADYGQYVTIPDTAFVSWLQTHGLDSCMNGNQLDTTCPAVLNLTLISCNMVSIKDLNGIQYFKGLTTLNCTNGSLAFIPFFPPNLITIDCGGNAIHSLPTLPPNLQTLICGFNPLNNLPTLPTTLISLQCTGDSLINLPELPNILQTLTCDYNYLNYLPSLPESLQSLTCGSNTLHLLPALPGGLTFLHCAVDSLTSLPELPDSMTFFSCAGNPRLMCIPKLKTVVDFYFSGTSITCLPNYGNITNSHPSLSTVPLCGEGNTNGCPVYTSINSISDGANLSIYPNPTSSKLEIELQNIPTERGQISILDIAGQLLNKQSLNQGSKTEIDVSVLPAGIYFLEVKSENQNWVKKFVRE